MRNFKIESVTGDNPALRRQGQRTYYPHVRVGLNKFAGPSDYHKLTINQIDHQMTEGSEGGLDKFDELARLFAASPELRDVCYELMTIFTTTQLKALQFKARAALSKLENGGR